MHNVLIIEDQQNTIDSYRALAVGSELKFIAPSDIGLVSFQASEDESVEEQLAKFLKAQILENRIDLVLLDTDLSRGRSLQTHSSYKSALRELGMPVCRYQKGGTPSVFEQLPQLQRTIRDGASAIWIPKALVSGNRMDELVPRLIAISEGFQKIRAALQNKPELLEGKHSPTDVMASVLENPELAYEFLGYAAQNLVYFARPEADLVENQISVVQRYATQLGYWLFNYIIMFPGPILTASAAAAYLNVQTGELDLHPDLRNLLAPAQYSGPFSDVERYYWRSGLIEILDACGGDIQNHADLQQTTLARIDTVDPGTTAYICMISGNPITESQAAVNPDWVPSGASEAKIDETVLDELGPLAGI